MSNLRGKSPPHPVELVKPPGCMRSVGSQRRGLPPPPRTQRRIASKCKLSPDTGDGAKRFAWSAAARSTARLATLLSGCMLDSSSVVKLERERRRRVLRRLFPLLLLRIAASLLRAERVQVEELHVVLLLDELPEGRLPRTSKCYTRSTLSSVGLHNSTLK